MKDTGNAANVTKLNSISFKYKSSIKNLAAVGNNGVLRNAKIVVPLRYLANIFRSSQIPLINCKIHLELNRSKYCVMSDTAGDTAFKTTNTCVTIVTLSTKDNVNLTKQLHERFKRPVY